jgi:hypothetical protein
MQLLYFEPDGERSRHNTSVALPYQTARDAFLKLGLHNHIAFEEHSDEDEEEVFDVQVKVRGRFQAVEHDESTIMLLYKDIGGDVTISTGSLFDSRSTEIYITHVPDRKTATLDRLLRLLDEIVAEAGKPKGRNT